MSRWVFILLVAVSEVAAAQSALGLSLERLAFEPGSPNSPTVGSGDSLRFGEVRAGTFIQTEYQPLVMRLDGEVVGSVVQWRETAHLTAAWGATDWLELSAQLPAFVQSGTDLSAYGVSPVAPAGLGTPITRARITFLRQARGQPLDLGVSLGVGLPLGTAEALARDPRSGLMLSPRLGLGRSLGAWLRVGLEAGLDAHELPQLLAYSTQNPASYGTLLSGAVTLSTLSLPVRVGVDVRGTATLGNSITSVEILAHARLPLGRTGFALEALAGPGIGRLPGTPAFRALVGLSWSPAPAGSVVIEEEPLPVEQVADAWAVPLSLGIDADLDGVPDDRDLCPFTVGSIRQRGCPVEGPEAEAARVQLADFLQQHIHFAFDSATLTMDEGALDEARALIEAVPEGDVVIEGHCDSIGPELYNLALSQRRAEAVERALIAHGVPPERLRTVGRGVEGPVASNADSAGRAQNRQVRFVVSPASPSVAHAF